MPFVDFTEQALRMKALQPEPLQPVPNMADQIFGGLASGFEAGIQKHQLDQAEREKEERKFALDLQKGAIEKAIGEGQLEIQGQGATPGEGQIGFGGLLFGKGPGKQSQKESFEEFARKEQFKAGLKNQTAKGSNQQKILPAGKATDVAEPAALDKLLSDVEASAGVTEEYGPITGRIAGMNPYDTKAQTFQSQISSAAQRVGKYLEGGVLRAEDVPKYAKMLPQLGDTPEVRQSKLENVRRLVLEKQQNDLGALGAAGYDVSGFKGMAREPTPVPSVLRSQNKPVAKESLKAPDPQRAAKLQRIQELRQKAGR